MTGSATRTYADVERDLRSSIAGDAISDISQHRDHLRVRCEAARRPDVLAVLKDLGFTFYSFCAGIDWPEEGRFEVMDLVQTQDVALTATLRCDVPRDQPRLPSATTVFGGADWHERETWEMFGIVFQGHPRLTRLLLPDWFEGYPMRKDYELPARVEKPWPGAAFEG